MSNESQVADHPERLGRLAEVFVRRRIAFAVDGRRRSSSSSAPTAWSSTSATTPSRSPRAVAAIARYDETPGRRAPPDRTPPPPGWSVVRVPNGEPVAIHGERRWGVEPVQRALDQLRGAGATAEPNHVLLGSQVVRGSPVGGESYFAGGMMFTANIVETDVGPVLRTTSDPAPQPAWLPQPLALAGHTPPKVLILDTGLRTIDGKGSGVEHPYLTCARLHAPWLQARRPGPSTTRTSSTTTRAAPSTSRPATARSSPGSSSSSAPTPRSTSPASCRASATATWTTSSAAFERADTKAGPFDLVVMSLGGYMSDDDGALFGAALDRLLGDGLGISAAGNQSTSRPYYPAALAVIVGVGGLGQADKAWFTNFGGWVDACAPAIDVVSTFFVGHQRRPRRAAFTGWARWSGTSFAAPKVAGVIAQEMYLTGRSAAGVWTRLSDYRRYRFPDLGTVFNV